MPLLHLLGRHLRPHRGALAILMLLHLAQSAATLGLPALNAALIDRGVLAGDEDVITSTGIIMLGVALARVAFALAATYLAARISARLGRNLRSHVFRQVTSFSAREVARFGAPSLITRAMAGFAPSSSYSRTWVGSCRPAALRRPDRLGLVRTLIPRVTQAADDVR